MDERTKRLLSWATGKKAYPLSIELSPTLRCNLNCLFCWRYGKKEIDYGEELSLRKYREIINEASKMDTKEIRIIGGGEPLLRKDVFEIMKEVKLKGMFGYICTNGTLFNERTIRQLVHFGWDHIKISLHGSNAKIHDYLVDTEGAFETVVKNIILFNKWKKKLKKRKPLLEIGMVLVKDNYKDVSNLVKLAYNFGVEYFFIEPITVYTKMGERLKLRKSHLKIFGKIAKEAKEMTDRYKIENNIDTFVNPAVVEKTGKMREIIKESKNSDKAFFSLLCYEPWYRMGIRVDGRVCPCGFFDEGSWENVRNKSLEEIWFGDYFNLRRNQILERKLPKHCERCCVTLVSDNKLIRSELEKFKFM